MKIHVLVSPPPSDASHTISINDRKWSLQPFDTDTSPDQPINYTCISYAWGTGRSENPLNPTSPFRISDRTLPALHVLTRHRPSCTAIWIDAFCIPVTEPSRAQSLSSMGYIYAASSEVIIVLSPAAAPALYQMLLSSKLAVTDLAVLEREEWVERAWTYQETVNGKSLFFTCEGENSVLVPDQRFFDCVGYALSHLTLSMVQKMRIYPKLNAFEDVMAETWTSAYEDRAALAVMANMDRRVQGRAEDHFYAMIGAITAEQADSSTAVLPSEAFMRVCEKRGDFSFIYSAAKRDAKVGRRWRPDAEGDMPSILPWHTWGSGQPGRLVEEGLELDDMVGIEPVAEMRADAKDFVENWLKAFWRDEGVPAGSNKKHCISRCKLWVSWEAHLV